MNAVTWILLGYAVTVTVLLVIALGANTDIVRELRQLRRRLAPFERRELETASKQAVEINS